MQLIETCVGGRRAGLAAPVIIPKEKPEEDRRPKRNHRTSPTYAGEKWGLTIREVEIIEALIRIGQPIVIANILGLSIKTIEAHLRNIRDKVDVYSTYQLIATYVAARYE